MSEPRYSTPLDGDVLVDRSGKVIGVLRYTEKFVAIDPGVAAQIEDGCRLYRPRKSEQGES